MRAFFCAVVLLSAGPAVAAEKSKALDPSKAYVLIDIEYLDDAMLKGSDQPGNVTLGRYDPVKRDIRGGELSPETALPAKQSPRVFISDKPLLKGKAVRQYLVPIEPDTWVIEGASGTAFSLGSMTFEAKAGDILDLGVVKPAVDRLDGEKAMSAGKLFLQALWVGPIGPKNMRPVRLDWRARSSGDFPLPPDLAGRTVAPVTFSSGAKFGNYLGGLVNRIGGRAQRMRELAAEQQAAAEVESEETAADNADASAEGASATEAAPAPD